MAVVTAGTVFGMSATVVTPPMAAERVPLGKSSLCRSPGSLMWTWRSTHPGGISESPWSISSSLWRTFLIAAIWPVSSIPMLKGSSRPRKNTRPLMTRTRRLQGPAHDGTAGLDLREDLGLELVDPCRRVEPRVGQQARFHASLGQEFGRIPTVLDGALGPFLDRLDEGEERLRVADATSQQAVRMLVERDEGAGLLLERLGDLEGAFGAFYHVGLEGLARNADGEFALPVRVRHPPRQQGACLNIVAPVLRLLQGASALRIRFDYAMCDWTRKLYRPRPLINRRRSCARVSRSSKS